MSSYFTKPATLARFVIARASDINDRTDATEAAFDLVEADVSTKLGAVDAMGGLIPNAGTRAGKALVFDVSGAPAVAVYLSEADVASLLAAAGAASSSAAAAAGSASSASGSASAASSSASAASGSASAASGSASSASGSASDASDSASAASDSVDLAQEWAAKDEDSVVSGGLFSALHYAAKAADSASGASSSASAASGSASTASGSATLAQDWAAKAEDSVVSGGLFSALHYAAKAADSAAAAATFDPSSYVAKAGSDMTGKLTITVANDPLKLVVSSGTNSGLNIDAAAGVGRYVKWTTSGTLRWTLGLGTASESGSNSGGNLGLWCYDDSGAFLYTVFAFTRATGQTSFGRKASFTATADFSTAAIKLSHGTAPGSPEDGDIWTTTAGLYARINGATVGPLGSGGPQRVVTYTSGTGTFTPLVSNSLVRVVLVAGGGGSGGAINSTTSCGGGGGGGQTVEWIGRVTGNQSYSVGAGGTAGTAGGGNGGSGGSTSFAGVVASAGTGGLGSTGSAQQPSGGYGGGVVLTSDGASGTTSTAGGSGFTAGGAGGNGYTANTDAMSYGKGAGSPIPNSTSVSVWPLVTTQPTQGPGGGGASLYSLGASPSATSGAAGVAGASYGGGAAGAWGGGGSTRAGAAGAGGIIIIEEYGA